MPIRPKPKITGSSSPLLQPGNLPVVRSGSWHTLPPYGAADTAPAPDARLFAVPLWPGKRCQVTGVACNVTQPAVGGIARIGMYTSANGLPLTLVAEYGTVSVAAVGIQILTGFSTPIEPDVYFLGIVRQGGPPNCELSSRDTWGPIVSELFPVLTGNLNSYYLDGVAGALPSHFGDVTGSIQGPSLAVQLT